MTEEQAPSDLYARGIWRMAPGLWCDRNVPDLIAVADERDTALEVRTSLANAGQLPALHHTQSKEG